MTADWSQSIRYITYIGTQVLMAATYPCYQVLFTFTVGTEYELPTILLLPIIKMLMKYLLSITTAHMEDLMPEALIFTADFFNALYVATCMQRTSSLITIATMMTLDLGSTTISIFALYRRTKNILGRLHNTIGYRNQTDLLTSVCLLCQNPQRFNKLNQIRVRSNLQYQLNAFSKDLVEMLAKVPNNIAVKWLSSSKKLLSQNVPLHVGGMRRTSSVHPTQNQKIAVEIVPRTDTSTVEAGPFLNQQLPQTPCILHDTLMILFTVECYVLAEYLEALIPMLYGGFVLLLVRLPSAEYHIDMKGVTSENVASTVHGVFILALLEIFSFWC
ncbi:unnamed protein product [Phytophthora fragariaefolia]|uniref:Unnamed protein product n=1 Tax=Phytophthora fragariaefolia TaxID=1490495 RepID=A0A9W7D4B9_9STRA|nr:unnamed protein product [Phytophthora fragariaefolia]